MITSAFLNLFYGAVSYLVSFLPSVSTNTAFGTAITTASDYISAIHSFLPLITISVLAIITFDVLFESGYLAYKVIYWIIRRFPTQS